jgi:TP901 family phage tail tape measure protein
MSVRTDVINLNVNINGNAAHNKLNELRKEAGELTVAIKGMKKGTEEYAASNRKLTVVKDQMTNLKKEIGLTSLSLKELRNEASKFTSLRDSVAFGTVEWKKYNAELQKVVARQAAVRSGVTAVQSTFGGLTKGLGGLAAGYLGFQFITSQISKLISGTARLSDSLANMQRVTGLTSSEVGILNDRLRNLDTRTSTEGLRNIVIVAGKLGVAKDQLFEFTKAVDKLVVALGDELGDASQITESLGKILNVFDGKITGDNITKLGNAFVELANTGAATGAFIADFDQRLSGIAKSSGISLGALSGLGAGLEELGGRVESSSSAINRLIIHVASDLPAAAKIAGKSTKEFTALFGKDPTEALLQYSQGLVKNKQSFAEVTKAFKDAGEEGVRTIETITKLGTSADYLRGRINDGKRSIEESTAITAAFELKNQTLGATLDKLGKKVLDVFLNGKIASFFKELVIGISDLITPTKSATQQFDDLSSKVNNLEKKYVTSCRSI